MGRGTAIETAMTKGYSMKDIRDMSWDRFIEVTEAEPKQIVVNQQGKRYVCLDVAYWDPDKKKSTHKRKIIGYLGEDGEVILTGSEGDTRPRTRPRPERYATVMEIGRTLLFDAIADRTGLRPVVEKVFGRDSAPILTCAYYLAGHSGALCHCEQWSAGSVTPFDGKLGDQRISELLVRITFDLRSRFFERWLARLGDDDNYALDITSISSYSDLMVYVRAGYNRDHENLEQVNMALLIGSKSRLAGYYTMLPGNINDKTSLRRFIRTVEAHGFRKFSMVMDKGFYSAENVDEIYRLGVRFTISVENRVARAREAIDAVRDTLSSFDNFLRLGTSSVYCHSELRHWDTDGKSHRCYTHVYFDPRRKEDEIRHFYEKLDDVRRRILAGEDDARELPMARKYLVVTHGRGISVAANQKAIEDRLSYAGYLVILSNHVKDPREALRIYRDKETAENGFDDLKNEMDLMRLRIHSEATMEGKVFIAFLALVLRMEMSNVMEADPTLCNLSRREVIEEMTLLRRSSIGDSVLYTERTKLQKNVIRAFGISAPFKDVIPAEAGDEAADLVK